MVDVIHSWSTIFIFFFFSQEKDSSKLYSASVNADCIDLEHGKVCT